MMNGRFQERQFATQELAVGSIQRLWWTFGTYNNHTSTNMPDELNMKIDQGIPNILFHRLTSALTSTEKFSHWA